LNEFITRAKGSAHATLIEGCTTKRDPLQKYHRRVSQRIGGHRKRHWDQHAPVHETLNHLLETEPDVSTAPAELHDVVDPARASRH
jgi:hypothetical protein